MMKKRFIKINSVLSIFMSCKLLLLLSFFKLSTQIERFFRVLKIESFANVIFLSSCLIERRLCKYDIRLPDNRILHNVHYSLSRLSITKLVSILGPLLCFRCCKLGFRFFVKLTLIKLAG